MVKENQKETVSHKGYDIYKNNYYSATYPATRYQYYSTIDCDAPMGSGKTITECMKQIDELAF